MINIGYFVPIKTSFNLIRSHFEQTSSLGLLRLIAPLLAGVDREELIESDKILDQLLAIILKSEYTDNFQVNIDCLKKFVFDQYVFLGIDSNRTSTYLSIVNRKMSTTIRTLCLSGI